MPALNPGETSGAVKDTSRDGRLSYSNQAENALRKELSSIALKTCATHISDFGNCANKEGLMVVFNCRKLNDGMNQCLNAITNDDNFEKFKAKRAKEIGTK